MKLRVLGCSGAIAQSCRTTSFLVDRRLLIDAGTGVGDLTLEDMAQIDDLVITHSHLDHIAALPLMLDAVAALRKQALRVHALPETILALQTHVFNNLIWPDFSRIPSPEAPFVRFQPLLCGERRLLDGKWVEALPAVHTVPAIGVAVSEGTGPAWVFSGDTGRNPAFWERINQMPVSMLVIETAFSDREAALAERSQHLCPALLAQELDHIRVGHRFPVAITHTKPSETELIMDQITRWDRIPSHPGDLPHDIRWLSAGQEFVL